MQRSHDGEQQERRGCQIAGKEDGEGREAYHQHRFTRKSIDHIATERAHHQRRDGIAREHQSYHVLGGAEMLTQVERQQRCQHIEGEE